MTADADFSSEEVTIASRRRLRQSPGPIPPYWVHPTHTEAPMPTIRRHLRALLPFATVVAALVLAGCAAPASTPAAASTTEPAAATPAGDVVTVRMTDFQLALDPTVVGPGPHTFHAVNAGKAPHSIVIDGPGVTAQRIAGVVQPGQSADLTVTLQSGAYDMYCPVGNHRAMGMEVRFTVGGGAAATATATSAGTGAGAY